MNEEFLPRTVPIGVFFGGSHPDQRTHDLCVEEARSLSRHSRRIDACDILVHERSYETEIRIDVHTVDGDVIIERFATTPSEPELRTALRSSFARIAQRADQTPEPRRGRAPRDRTPVEPVEPPPCVWYG